MTFSRRTVAANMHECFSSRIKCSGDRETAEDTLSVLRLNNSCFHTGSLGLIQQGSRQMSRRTCTCSVWLRATDDSTEEAGEEEVKLHGRGWEQQHRFSGIFNTEQEPCAATLKMTLCWFHLVWLELFSTQSCIWLLFECSKGSQD